MYWRGGALLKDISYPGYNLKIPLVTSVSEIQGSFFVLFSSSKSFFFSLLYFLFLLQQQQQQQQSLFKPIQSPIFLVVRVEEQ